MAGKRIVSKLRCSTCAKFKVKIASRRNFSDQWIVGADSVRSSNIRDHARADQHTHALNLLKKEQAEASGRIAQGINLDTSLKNCPTIFEKWPIKIDFVLTNGLPNFRPYFVLCSGCGYQEVGVASGSGWNLWVWLVGGMYGCGYQEVGVVGRRRVWLAGGIYGCGYQEEGVVSRRRVWLAGGMYGCSYQEVGVVGIYWCG